MRIPQKAIWENVAKLCSASAKITELYYPVNPMFWRPYFRRWIYTSRLVYKIKYNEFVIFPSAVNRNLMVLEQIWLH